MTEAQKSTISLIICTRNRAQAVVRSLDAVATAALNAPELAIELIVVDNGSTDGTPQVLADWAAAATLKTRVVVEPRPGLSCARNAALKVARHEILAMTDDDCEMRPDYFSMLAAAHSARGAPAIIGGRVDLGDPRDLPITIKTESEKMTYRLGKKPGGFVMGANLTFHQEVLRAVGAFDERFGAGAPFVAAEDTDYILRASLLGIPVEYDPSFAVNHFHGRRALSEAKALLKGYSYGDGALYAKHLFGSLIPLKLLKAAAANAVKETLGRTPRHPIMGREYAFKLIHNLRGLAAYAMGSRVRRP